MAIKAVKVVDDPEKFKLLADETRRKIIFLLRAKEMTVSQIASTLELTPQAIYHHIKKLQDADLVQVAKEERMGHLIESYYRSTAEAFICSVGATPSGREFFEKQMETALKAIVDLGFDLEYGKEDIQVLIQKQDDLQKCCGSEDFEKDMKDELGNMDANTLAIVKEYGKLLAMTDEEFVKRQKLEGEFRETLKSLQKK